jgi:two-component sensor histidine kinase
VQSIASQTLRNATDVGAARQALEARIMALSKAHTILSERKWHDTEIGHLVDQELRAFGGDQVRFGGPALVVNAKTTVALALVLHELATNAAKHGALSTDRGNLAVNWSEGEEDSLVIDWVERGGPPLREPGRGGFGTRLLRTVVSGELGGTLDLNHDDAGMRLQIVVPRSAYDVGEVQLGQ